MQESRKMLNISTQYYAEIYREPRNSKIKFGKKHTITSSMGGNLVTSRTFCKKVGTNKNVKG